MEFSIEAKKLAEKLTEPLPKRRGRFLGVENFKVGYLPCMVGDVFMYCTNMKHRDLFCKETIKKASVHNKFFTDALMFVPYYGFVSAGKEVIDSYLSNPRLEFESKRLLELWETLLRDLNAYVNTLEHEKGYLTSRTSVRVEYIHTPRKSTIYLKVSMVAEVFNSLTTDELLTDTDKPIYFSELNKNFTVGV